MKLTYKIIICLSVILHVNYSINAQNISIPPTIVNNAMYQMGYLDVTALGIDNTGTIDVTDAINEAIVMARDSQLVCYFPSGTYLISDTIKAMLLSYDHNGDPDDRHSSDRRFPCVLEGECTNRPILKLKDGAPGFNNPTDDGSKAAIMIWASPTDNVNYDGITYPKGTTDPNGEFPGIAFNQIFRNFVIDLGDNNPGAVGIRFAGAQGSSMENVKIIATGAYAGMHRMMGQASGYYNIEVIGGRYGVQINSSRLSEYAFMSGVRFINQTQYVIKGLAWFPINITGFYMESPHGRVFNNHPASRAGISLIDGVIYATGTATEACFKVYSKRHIYLQNVDIKGNEKVIDIVSDPSASITTNANEWTKYGTLAYSPDGQGKWKNLTECTIDQQDFEFSLTVNEPSDTTEIFNKHIGPIRDCFDMNNAINVQDAIQMNGKPAYGNGDSIDTKALQWALDNHHNIFLPKGTYLIDSTLLLKYNTNLRGVGKVFSSIKATPSFNVVDAPILKTINHKNANTKISNFMIEIDPFANYNLTGLHWQAGRNSVVDNIMFGVDGFLNETIQTGLHYGYKIDDSGGGRWYNTCAEWHKLRYTTAHNNYRAFYVENTTEPFSLYSLNVERVRTEPQAEINNASNINIYSFKAEAGGSSGANTTQQPNVPLRINNSNKINLYSGTGKVELEEDEGIVEMNNCVNSKILHVKSFKDNYTVKKDLNCEDAPPVFCERDTFIFNTIKTDCAAMLSQVHLGIYQSPRNILYVNHLATGNNNGKNWADAFTNLQSALNSPTIPGAVNEVWVAEGTYSTNNQNDDRSQSFVIPDGFKIYGGFKGYETNLNDRNFTSNPTILSGKMLANENAYHVIKIDGLTTEALVDGFIIEGGYANGTGTNNRGGGVFITINNTGTAFFENNIIQNNYAVQGGGFYNAAFGSLTNNEIRFNEAAINGSSIYNWGQNCNLRLESGNYVHSQICNTCFNYLYTDVDGNLHVGEDNSIED